jgi:hypothetical protein
MAEGPSENIPGIELGEGMGKSCEVKERAGKPTMSGRVPLMPTHLAEAGYQAEKKGVRGTGTAKKPKSKGYAKNRHLRELSKFPEENEHVNSDPGNGDELRRFCQSFSPHTDQIDSTFSLVNLYSHLNSFCFWIFLSFLATLVLFFYPLVLHSCFAANFKFPP